MAGTKELSKVLDETEINTLSEIIQDKVERQLQVLHNRIDEFKAKYERVCVNSGKTHFGCSHSAGAQLSRDILFHFWQKYFFS